MKKSACVLALCIAAMLCVESPLSAQGIRRRELLGVRVGGVIGSSPIRDAFGSGSELELHFIEGLGASWGVSLALSSHNFGASKDTLKNIEFTGLNREVKLSIFSITGAAYAMRPIGGRFTATGEAGLGLYAVTAAIPSGFYEGTRTENRFGLYGGAGMLLRLSRAVSLNLNVKYHYIFIGSDEFEPIHFYTGRTNAQFVQVSFGILLFTK